MTANYSEEAIRAIGTRTLAGRIGQPQEVANTVAFLVSEESSYIYGEIININGGGSFGL